MNCPVLLSQRVNLVGAPMTVSRDAVMTARMNCAKYGIKSSLGALAGATLVGIIIIQPPLARHVSSQMCSSKCVVIFKT